MSTDNLLYRGNNLDVLWRHVDDGSADLIYLDSPFNSNGDYNILRGTGMLPADSELYAA